MGHGARIGSRLTRVADSDHRRTRTRETKQRPACLERTSSDPSLHAIEIRWPFSDHKRRNSRVCGRSVSCEGVYRLVWSLDLQKEFATPAWQFLPVSRHYALLPRGFGPNRMGRARRRELPACREDYVSEGNVR